MAAKELSYQDEYKTMQQTFLKQDKNLTLKEIIIKIKSNKDYIFTFINHNDIKEITRSIKKSYRFNRDEVEDIITVVITEYFYDTQIDVDNFSVNNFLDDFKKEIVNRTQKEVYHSYSAKEMPLSGSDFYEEAFANDFQDKSNSRIDFTNAINKMSPEYQQVFKLYYFQGYTQREIAQFIGIDKMRVNRILIMIKNNLEI